MLELLKEAVCNAKLELVRRSIVIYTWGRCQFRKSCVYYIYKIKKFLYIFSLIC